MAKRHGYTARVVTGRDENGTTYDEPEWFPDEDKALGWALERTATVDIFDGDDEVTARVHPDGGIDWRRTAAL